MGGRCPRRQRRAMGPAIGTGVPPVAPAWSLRPWASSGIPSRCSGPCSSGHRHRKVIARGARRDPDEAPAGAARGRV